MNLPGGIPAGLACRLAGVWLPRPITRRLEMITMLLASGMRVFRTGSYDHVEPLNRDIVCFSSEDLIKDAVARVSSATHNRLSTRRTRDIKCFVRYILDFPEQHNGNIVGLAEKAIRWHRDQHEAEIEATLQRLGSDQQVARPPIALPESSDVRLLSTVDEICSEGAEMGHCIAAYAEGAVRGEYYLFAVEHNGELATVQVCARSGQVLQSHGPKNRQNAASDWGARQLRRWGKSLSNAPPVRTFSVAELAIEQEDILF